MKLLPLNGFPIGETPNSVVHHPIPETSSTRDVGLNLREALKQQLAIIHARVEAKKIAKLALAEVRELLAKEQEEKELELGRKEIAVRVKERLATKLKDEEEKMEKEEMEKAVKKLRMEKTKRDNAKKEGMSKEDKWGGGGAKEGEKKDKMEGKGKEAQHEDETRKESGKEKS
ncbi:uncharacterized protein [Leuresthes tenuis]|uniref:uncharacterized protein n=1 Tax=Leuresthes tenuis TaxID=355514 RepID=UPI003B50AFAB